MPESTGRRLLTAKEVAAIMRVSTMTVYRLVNSGELPSYRIERQVRIDEADVNRYLAARYTEAG